MASMDEKDWAKETAKIAGEIKGKMKSCESDDGFDRAKKIRTVAAEIIVLLLSVGLAYMETVPPNGTAIHPRNRSGLGVVPSDVHSLLFLILSQGFVWLEVQGKMWAFERSPKPQESKKSHDFNRKVVEKSKGLLAAPNPDARILTIAGTHTNQGARCVIHETKGIPPQGPAKKANDATEKSIDIWTREGYISKEKVFATNPAYKEFTTKGGSLRSSATKWIR